MTRQWLRKASLVVSSDSQELDLSALHFTFSIRAAEVQTPNLGTFKIYNLAEATAQKLQKEFNRVRLQVGYEGGDVGLIFDGELRQSRRGRDNPTDTFVDLVAAEGDAGMNFAVVNMSVAAGSTLKDRLDAAAGQMAVHGVTRGYTPDLTGQKLPRGRVLFGMARDALRVESAAYGMSYSIQRGEIQFVPIDGFKPGEAIVVNAATGMIGWPEQTEFGIRLRTLINPRMSIGSKLKIDNASIQKALDSAPPPGDGAGNSAQFQSLQAQVPLNDDGVYRVYVIDYVGDTRGNDWYADIICLSVDDTVIPLALASRAAASPPAAS